jgi:hypothetical protein
MGGEHSDRYVRFLKSLQSLLVFSFTGNNYHSVQTGFGVWCRFAYFHSIHASGNRRRSYAREPIANRNVRLY